MIPSFHRLPFGKVASVQDYRILLAMAGVAVFNSRTRNPESSWPQLHLYSGSIALHRGTGGDEYERVKTLPRGGGVVALIVIGLIVGAIRPHKHAQAAPGSVPEVEVVQVQQQDVPIITNGSARSTDWSTPTSEPKSQDIC